MLLFSAMAGKKKKQTEEPELVGLAVVRERQVNLSEMSKVRPSAATPASDASASNSPRPQPSQTFNPIITPMRRRHKNENQERPSYMSEVKI